MEQIKGYKATKINMMCRYMKFEVGKTYTTTGVIEPCFNGFHFCEDLNDIDNYYNLNNCIIFEVIGSGDIIREDNKTIASEITFIRKINPDEFTNLCYKKEYHKISKKLEYYDDVIANNDFDNMMKIIETNDKHEFMNYLSGKNLYSNEIIEYYKKYKQFVSMQDRDIYNRDIIPSLIHNGYNIYNEDFIYSNTLNALIYKQNELAVTLCKKSITSNMDLMTYHYTMRLAIMNDVLKLEDIDKFNKFDLFQSPHISYALIYKGFYLKDIINYIPCIDKSYSVPLKIEVLNHKFVFRYLFDSNHRVRIAAKNKLLTKIKSILK